MFPDSTIDAGTIQAYANTDYRVDGAVPFVLRVGEFSTALAGVHKAQRVDCSAYITACNPFSQSLDASTNAKRHAAFVRELQQRSFVYLEGIGQHPSDNWPGEASALVLGINLDEARKLGNQREQNAIIWNGVDATPRLILLR